MRTEIKYVMHMCVTKYMSVEEAGSEGERDIVRTVKSRFMQVFYLSGVVGD